MRRVAFTITQSYVVFRDISEEDFRALCTAKGSVIVASEYTSEDLFFELMDARASDDAITTPGFIQIRTSKTAEIVEALQNVNRDDSLALISNGLIAENGGLFPL